MNESPGWPITIPAFRTASNLIPSVQLDYLSDAAQERPHSPFLLFKRRRLSWGEVEQLSDRFAVALVKARGEIGWRSSW